MNEMNHIGEEIGNRVNGEGWWGWKRKEERRKKKVPRRTRLLMESTLGRDLNERAVEH